MAGKSLCSLTFQPSLSTSTIPASQTLDSWQFQNLPVQPCSSLWNGNANKGKLANRQIHSGQTVTFVLTDSPSGLHVIFQRAECKDIQKIMHIASLRREPLLCHGLSASRMSHGESQAVTREDGSRGSSCPVLFHAPTGHVGNSVKFSLLAKHAIPQTEVSMFNSSTSRDSGGHWKPAWNH